MLFVRVWKTLLIVVSSRLMKRVSVQESYWMESMLNQYRYFDVQRTDIDVDSTKWAVRDTYPLYYKTIHALFRAVYASYLHTKLVLNTEALLFNPPRTPPWVARQIYNINLSTTGKDTDNGCRGSFLKNCNRVKVYCHLVGLLADDIVSKIWRWRRPRTWTVH